MHDDATQTQTKPIPELKEDFVQAVTAANDIAQMVEPLDRELDEKITAIRKSHIEQHAETYHLAEQVKEALESTETALRSAVVGHYNATGQKTLDNNLGVRVSVKFVYENDAAVEWAEKNAPVMIVRTVDRKTFESLPTIGSLPFVKVDETATAVIKGLK